MPKHQRFEPIAFDLARGLLAHQRPKCPECSEMMVVQDHGGLRWVCVRAGRCRGIRPLDKAKFLAWVKRHGLTLPKPKPEPRPEPRYSPPPRCPKCETPMKLCRNEAERSEFWGCSRFPQCTGARRRIRA